MVYRVILISLLLVLFNYSTSCDAQTPDASLQEHVKNIDAMLAEMQSHSKAQEQKYSAVLASLLSKLTSTTDELGDLKASHNETILKLSEKDAELSGVLIDLNVTNTKLDTALSKLKDLEIGHYLTISMLEEKNTELTQLSTNYNTTVAEVHELRANHTNAVKELEETRSKLEDLEKCPELNGNIGFQLTLAMGMSVAAHQPVQFDQVLYDTASSYEMSTGKYLIPMSGTYLVWIEFSILVHGYKGGIAVKSDQHVIDLAYGSISHPQTTTAISSTYLHQGQTIWVIPTRNLTHKCKFGAVLLNAH